MRTPEGWYCSVHTSVHVQSLFFLFFFLGRKTGEEEKLALNLTIWWIGGCGCIATDSSRVPKKQKKKEKERKTIWSVKYSLPAKTTLKGKCVSIQPDLEKLIS